MHEKPSLERKQSDKFIEQRHVSPNLFVDMNNLGINLPSGSKPVKEEHGELY